MISTTFNIIFIISLLIISVKSLKFLVKEQWNDIKVIIQNKNTPPIMREKVNKILYTHYKDYALYKANEFKKLHRYKCCHISSNDLHISACNGLIESIKNYNGDSYFLSYANIYIISALYSIMTELHPISPISKKNRMSKKNIYLKKPKIYYLGHGQYDISSKNNNENTDYDKYVEYWEIINMSNLNPKVKRILHYKYNFYFDKIRSNKEISELMHFSEEYIRLELAKSKNIISLTKL